MILVATAQDVLMVPAIRPFIRFRIDRIRRGTPGQLNYASLGPGTSAHLWTRCLTISRYQDQNVSHSSLAQAATDLMSSHVSLFIPTLGGHIGNIKSGNIRALAVSGGRGDTSRRSDLQRTRRSVCRRNSWYGIYAPKGTPREIVIQVNQEVGRILEASDVKERTAVLGF